VRVADEVDDDVDLADDILEPRRQAVDDDGCPELAQPAQVGSDPVAVTCAPK
jgi:hypothetical protein